MAARVLLALGLLLWLGHGPLLAQRGIQDADNPVAPARPRATPRPAGQPVRNVSADTVRSAVLPAQDSASEALLLQKRSDSLQRRVDQLQSVTSAKMPRDQKTRGEFEKASKFAWRAMALWLALVILYVMWAVHRYVINYGLSNREWKVLYPEVYETWLDRSICAMVGGPTYEARRKALIEFRVSQRTLAANTADDSGAPATAVTVSDVQPFEEPSKNPYQCDSFGLPPGTLRGILALSLLFTLVVMECVNLYSPGDLEAQFQGLVTAFQMVLAFYFGSRAVEVLQAKASGDAAAAERSRAAAAVRPEPTAPPASPETGPASPSAGAALTAAPAEDTQLPASRSQARFANLVAAAKDAPAAAPAAPPTALPSSTPLAQRTLALTASFETGRGFPDCFAGITGNFDGQGLSWGALQWNIGQGSVQPLWKEMRDKNQAELKTIMGSLYDEFAGMLDRTKDEQMKWALSIQSMVTNRTNAWRIADNWKAALSALGKCNPMIAIQVAQADRFLQIARGVCRDYGLTTERGAALMFDIRVQNGSVDRGGAGQLIRHDFELVNPALTPEEQQVERMRIIARRRSAVSAPAWRKDVLERKMTIAEGRGTVHGRTYDLAGEFGLRLAPLP